MSTITAAEAVKHFAKQKITVRMPKLGKGGKAMRDEATKRFVMEDQDLAAEHVIGAREDGGKVFITTADGNKYSAEKLAK